jgi:subtilase family serine protease
MFNFAKFDKNSTFSAFEDARNLGEFASADGIEAVSELQDQGSAIGAAQDGFSAQSTLQGLGLQLSDQTMSRMEAAQTHSTVSDLLQTASATQVLNDMNSALATLNLSSATGRMAADAIVSDALQSILGAASLPQLVPFYDEPVTQASGGGDDYLKLVSSVTDGMAVMATTTGGTSTTTSGITAKATSAFHVNLVWDASVNNAPSTFKTAIQAAASLLEQYIVTPITVNIAVGWGEIGGFAGGVASPVAANSAAGGTMGDIYQSYATIKQELAASATSVDDKSSLAALPSTSPYGNVYYDIAGSQAKAFGLTSANSTSLDGVVGFATNWPSGDLIAAALHEITHAMGRNSGWAAPSNGSDVTLLDLMRFSAPGVFANDGTKASTSALQYFSVDGGKTVLAHYALTSDLGDWYSDSLTANDPNNAYLSSGSNALTSVDLRQLDVMGFTLVGAAPATPDLVVSAATPAAASVIKGNVLNFSYTINDVSTTAVGANTASIAVDGVIVGTAQVTALSGNGSITLTGSLATSSLSVGQHTVTIMADSGNVIAETDETNNSKSFVFSVTAATGPDLVVSGLTTTTTSVAQGNGLVFNYTITDIGTAAAVTSTTSYAIDGVVKGTFATMGLAAGATTSGSGSFSTTGLTIGSHTLTLMADSANTIAEGNETNNSLSLSFTVTSPSPDGADLSIGGLSAANTSLVQGDQLVFAYTLKNTGTTASAAAKVAYAIDTQPTSTSYSGTNSFGAVSANSWVSSPIDMISTANLSVGTHTLYVKADSGNAVAETNESNNISSLTFTVLGKSDFLVSSASAPTTVKAGSAFNLNYTVTNTGQGNPNSYSYAAIYFDGRANAVSYDIIKNLAPGASQSITDTFSTAGVARGTHTLTITLDALNFVNERNEFNNSKTITFTIV